jgi:hypothetical protein
VGAYNYPWVPQVSKSNLYTEMNIFSNYLLLDVLPILVSNYLPELPVVSAYKYPWVFVRVTKTFSLSLIHTVNMLNVVMLTA